MFAGRDGSLGIVILLIENGADLKCVNEDGFDVFWYARNQHDILDYLNQIKKDRAQLSRIQY